MLSKTITQKNRIFAICEKSGDIEPGTVFHGIIVADQNGFDSISRHSAVVCCGELSDSELLFRTEDGRYYFSICDGWGDENGIAYGLSTGIFYDFKHPTTVETILAECKSNIGTYSTWCGAMAYQSRKYTLDAICSVMKNMKKKKGLEQLKQ